jgi:phenylalanine-4-hydroxylase
MNNICKLFSGDPIPYIEYTQEEHETWKQAYLKLRELRTTHTCREYQENIKQMEKVGLITPDRIPQLKDLNAYIQRNCFLT